MRGRFAFVVMLGLGFIAPGCGGADNHPPTEDEMQQGVLTDVGELYRVYIAKNKKPPASLADLTPLQMMSPMGLEALKKGDVVVFYKVELPDTGEEPGKGPGDVVLAYEKQVPESGGRVLMLNRTIKTMTADEFKAANKAGTLDTKPGAAAKAK